MLSVRFLLLVFTIFFPSHLPPCEAPPPQSPQLTSQLYSLFTRVGMMTREADTLTEIGAKFLGVFDRYIKHKSDSDTDSGSDSDIDTDSSSGSGDDNTTPLLTTPVQLTPEEFLFLHAAENHQAAATAPLRSGEMKPLPMCSRLLRAIDAFLEKLNYLNVDLTSYCHVTGATEQATVVSSAISGIGERTQRSRDLLRQQMKAVIVNLLYRPIVRDLSVLTRVKDIVESALKTENDGSATALKTTINSDQRILIEAHPLLFPNAEANDPNESLKPLPMGVRLCNAIDAVAERLDDMRKELVEIHTSYPEHHFNEILFPNLTAILGTHDSSASTDPEVVKSAASLAASQMHYYRNNKLLADKEQLREKMLNAALEGLHSGPPASGGSNSQHHTSQ